MVAESWVEATNAIQIGKATTATPRIRTMWLNIVSQGRFSTIGPSIVNPPLDVAELHDGQGDDDEDGRLCGRDAEILATETVLVDLEDQDLGRLTRPALGERIDDAERVEEGIDDVDDHQEEAGRRQQREDDGPEPPPRSGAI